MNNAILIQQVYPNEDAAYIEMLTLTRERNKEYCLRWQMDYQCLESASSVKYADAKVGAWSKVELIKFALNKTYQYIIWLDADALIKDMDTDLRDGCIDGIGACWQRIPQLNHWNVGVLYVANTQPVSDFIEDWLAGYPGLGDGWNEQGVFNKLAMNSRVVQTISDRWNSTLNYSMVPDAVILGYHGYGDANQRLNAMQDTLKTLESREAVR
jgi:hypothetical protein